MICLLSPDMGGPLKEINASPPQIGRGLLKKFRKLLSVTVIKQGSFSLPLLNGPRDILFVFSRCHKMSPLHPLLYHFKMSLDGPNRINHPAQWLFLLILNSEYTV